MTTETKMSDEEALRRFEEGIDLDPEKFHTRAETDDIRAAARMIEMSQTALDEAIIDARRRGISWLEIALALEVSPQAVRQKYRDHV